METATSDCSRISKTAKFVARMRARTSILHAREIAEASRAEEAFQTITGRDSHYNDLYAPLLELRYRSVDAALRSARCHQILELASGLSPRCLIWTMGKGSQYRYCATDLPDMHQESARIFRQILGKDLRPNLRLAAGSALDLSTFVDFQYFFDKSGPLAIICEGLLPYLGREELTRVVKNVHTVLKQRGGVWITPDLPTRERMSALLSVSPDAATIIKNISESTGRDLRGNAFQTVEEAEDFIKGFGFELRRFPQKMFATHLTSLAQPGVIPPELEEMLEHAYVWLIRPV